MAKPISRRQLDIYEVRTDDGGVGLVFGDSPLYMGYDEEDLMRLLGEVFGFRDEDDFFDGDLREIATQYLDKDEAEKRHAMLRGF